MPDELDEVLKKMSKKDLSKLISETEDEPVDTTEGEEVIEDEVEEEVEEEVLPKPKKQYARGPGAPRAHEHAKRRELRERQSKQKNDLGPQLHAVEPVGPVTGNPRFARDGDEAPQGARREQIWKKRQEEGRGVQRRPVLSKDGIDTGATTSSLE